MSNKINTESGFDKTEMTASQSRFLISDFNWKEIVDKAVCELYKRDSKLFKYDVHEVAISHRLAIYIEQILKEYKIVGNYSIDLEYNRNLKDSKHLSPNQIKKERPDIVVHERGTHENNLLIIEIKKNGSEVNSSDDNKLKGATSPDQEFKYDCGLFLILKRKSVHYTWYSEGEQEKKEPAKVSEKYGKTV